MLLGWYKSQVQEQQNNIILEKNSIISKHRDWISFENSVWVSINRGGCVCVWAPRSP